MAAALVAERPRAARDARTTWWTAPTASPSLSIPFDYDAPDIDRRRRAGEPRLQAQLRIRPSPLAPYPRGTNLLNFTHEGEARRAVAGQPARPDRGPQGRGRRRAERAKPNIGAITTTCRRRQARDAQGGVESAIQDPARRRQAGRTARASRRIGRKGRRQVKLKNQGPCRSRRRHGRRRAPDARNGSDQSAGRTDRRVRLVAGRVHRRGDGRAGEGRRHR
jgi:hypothetical protein